LRKPGLFYHYSQRQGNIAWSLVTIRVEIWIFIFLQEAGRKPPNIAETGAGMCLHWIGRRMG
jgi:hypothetical protein